MALFRHKPLPLQPLLNVDTGNVFKLYLAGSLICLWCSKVEGFLNFVSIETQTLATLTKWKNLVFHDPPDKVLVWHFPKQLRAKSIKVFKFMWKLPLLWSHRSLVITSSSRRKFDMKKVSLEDWQEFAESINKK